jgi:sirohydrochlorin ferrochelatase
MRKALQLIAHGSRQAEANADLQYFVEEFRRGGEYAVVEASFLELAEPTIQDAGARCVDQGAEQVVLLPCFLSAGVHVQRDLSEARRCLAKRFPKVKFLLAQPLGQHPLLMEVLMERARTAEHRKQ